MTQNFTLVITKVIPLYPTKVYIEFSVTGIELLKVPIPTLVYKVWRSEDSRSTSQFELLNPSGTTSFFYVDNTPRLLSFFANTFYKVTTTCDGKMYSSTIVNPMWNLRKDEYLRRRKMLYDEEIVLRKFSGRKIAILKRRHVGPRCSVCWDPNTGNVTKSHCSVCFGTGFKDPYYEPFVTYGARMPLYKEVDEIQNDHGNELDYSKYQILDYPSVDGQDLLVDLEMNDRYKVDRVEQTEMRRRMVHQELVVTKLSRTDAEYNIVISPTLLGVNPTVGL